MVADDLADYLSTQGVGTAATDLFVGTLPSTVTQGIAIRETGGIFSAHTMGASPSGIGSPKAKVERPRVQVFSRAATYATARAKIQDCFNLLDGLQATTINGVLYQWVAAVQSPIDLGLNANFQAEWSCNFDVVKAVSTSTTT
ncbi:MAG: minor capsid protein [Acidobacteria bacterium]|nr:minor capsid protein [Acidobacteriota bacterium]